MCLYLILNLIGPLFFINEVYNKKKPNYFIDVLQSCNIYFCCASYIKGKLVNKFTGHARSWKTDYVYLLTPST